MNHRQAGAAAQAKHFFDAQQDLGHGDVSHVTTAVLIERLSTLSGIAPDTTRLVVDALFAEIALVLSTGGSVRMPSIGSFSVEARPPRMAHSLASNRVELRPGSTAVSFRPSAVYLRQIAR